MAVGCHGHVVDADESNDQRNPFNLVTGDKMEICVCESGNLCNSSAVPIQARFKSQVCKSHDPCECATKLYLGRGFLTFIITKDIYWFWFSRQALRLPQIISTQMQLPKWLTWLMNLASRPQRFFAYLLLGWLSINSFLPGTAHLSRQ